MFSTDHPLRTFLAGAAAGAGLMYLLDPRMGRSRRAQHGDQLQAAVRRPVRQAQERAEGLTTVAQDRAKGIAHEVARDESDQLPENDQTLVSKIRSELLGNGRWSRYTINVDAADGHVALRGEVERPDDIRDLVRAVEQMPGVASVDNLLHVPGQEAPTRS